MSKPNPFDQCSEPYGRFRPDYPPELINDLQAVSVGLVADAGAGTGKASAPLVARGVPVLSIEPSLPMIRQGLRSYPNLQYICATAEDLPLAAGVASTVICAQAFHWFNAPRALHEFARVLHDGGHVAIFWNTRDTTGAAARLFEDVILKWNPEHVPSYQRDDWGDRFTETGLFRPVDHRRYCQIVAMTADDWVGLSKSVSYIQSIGPERVPLFEADLREGLARLTSLDCVYTTEMWIARTKRPAAAY